MELVQGRRSWFGLEGGPEGLMAYTRPVDPAPEKAAPGLGVEPGLGAEPGDPVGPIDRTAKLYVGGKQARPDGGYSRPVHGADGGLMGHVGLANRKDLRNAVEAVTGAKLRESYVEEMTAFHVWGLVGNELLTRWYVWLAEKEF